MRGILVNAYIIIEDGALYINYCGLYLLILNYALC